MVILRTGTGCLSAISAWALAIGSMISQLGQHGRPVAQESWKTWGLMCSQWWKMHAVAAGHWYSCWAIPTQT